MAGDTLTVTEVAILLALMAEAQEISNVDLKDRFGIEFKAATRKRLNDQKLVTSRMVGRRLYHELAEDGWGRCRDELTAPCPPHPGTAGGALYALLNGLHRYLSRKDLSLPEVFGRTSYDPSDAEAAIRAAYVRAERRPAGWVALAELRPLLGNLPRQAVDDALIRMGRMPRISVLPEENQKALTQSDHDAAVDIGGRPHHFLLIEGA